MSNRVPAPARSVFARLRLRERIRDRDTAIYGLLLLIALVFPAITLYTSDGSTYLIALAGHAGTYVLLAIGLHVVVGFAGLAHTSRVPLPVLADDVRGPSDRRERRRGPRLSHPSTSRRLPRHRHAGL